MTIREYIDNYAKRMKNADTLTPHELANILVELSGWLTTMNVETVKAEIAYKVTKKEARDMCESTAEATAIAEATPQYADYLEKKAYRDSLKDMIGSVKYFLRVAEEEYKLTK